MAVLITGVSCVGKTAVGEALAKRLGVPFEDFDQAVERHLGAPISRLQQRYGTMERYREAAAGVLAAILHSLDGRPAVIALPPSGLTDPYWRHLQGRSTVTVALEEAAESILERIRFFDDDSQPLQKSLTPRERSLYLREIRRDMAYFGPSYRKAAIRVNMRGCTVTEAAAKTRDVLLKAATLPEPEKAESKPPSAGDSSPARRIRSA